MWIDDDGLNRFGKSEELEEIVSSGREEWIKWVREKIDQRDFRNLVLKFEKKGQKEIDLAQL